MISVYSDGSSTGRSNKPGGWGFVVLIDGKPHKAGYGGDTSTTNNIMEMRGAIEGLRVVRDQGLHTSGMRIELVSDSQYVLGMGNGSYSPTKNLELVKELKALCWELGVTFRWVKGHSKDPWNEKCDRLAKKGKLEAFARLEAEVVLEEAA